MILVEDLYKLSERTLAECVVRQSSIEGFSNPSLYVGLLKNQAKLGQSKMLPSLNDKLHKTLERSFGFDEDTTRDIVLKFLKKLLT